MDVDSKAMLVCLLSGRTLFALGPLVFQEVLQRMQAALHLPYEVDYKDLQDKDLVNMGKQGGLNEDYFFILVATYSILAVLRFLCL